MNIFLFLSTNKFWVQLINYLFWSIIEVLRKLAFSKVLLKFWCPFIKVGLWHCWLFKFLLTHTLYVSPLLPSPCSFHPHLLSLKCFFPGLPWWCSGWESACRCRGHGFETWSGKIPHAAERLGPWATTAEPVCLEPVLQERPR